MERLNSLLRSFALGRATDQLNGYDTKRRDEVIGKLQDRYEAISKRTPQIFLDKPAAPPA